MNIGTNYYNIYSQYSALFQKNSSAFGISKYSRMFSAENPASSGGYLFSTGALKYITDIKSASKGIKNALSSLAAGAFSHKGMVSSDESVLAVKSSLGGKYGVQSVLVKIDSAAAGQINEGTSLKSGDISGLSGQNRFSVEVGGQTKQLSISVGAGDTNKDVQQKMADAINGAGLGVRASVVADGENKMSSLRIEAAGTGASAGNTFSLKDIEGGAVAKLGADNMAQKAQNAVYSVNGGEKKTSEKNDVDLGGGLTVTLKKASDNEIRVSWDVDKSYAGGKLDDLVRSYNDLYAAAVNNSDDPKASRLFSQLVNVSKSYVSKLSSIGLEFDKDGRMSLNADKLGEALDNGKLGQFFMENSGKNYGFTNQLSRLADSVSRNTSNYVSKSAVGDSLTANFAYSGFGDMIQYNYLSAGSIFDYMF